MNLSNITNINNYMRNSSESVKLSQRSENYYINNNNSKKKIFLKQLQNQILTIREMINLHHLILLI